MTTSPTTPPADQIPARPAALGPDVPVVLDTRVVTGEGGGPDKTILNSPRFLAPEYRMLCAYMHPPGDAGFVHLRARAEALGTPLLPIPDRGMWDWGVPIELLRICRRERVAIWHGHDYKSDALGLLLRPFWRMWLITTVHGWGVAGTKPLYNHIDRHCLRRYDRVICVSEDLRDQCLASGVHDDRCVLIENAIDTAQFSRSLGVAEAKARLDIPAGCLVVGAVGRLSAEKGYDLLVRAADRLLSEGLDLVLLIAGEGGERARLESLIAGLGRGDRIRLLGYRADTLQLYHAMDAFALSSLSEGLPNVLLEAMALSVPVVATRIAGIPRLIGDGKNGLLVEAGSVEPLAGHLGRLLRDEGLRDRLGRSGRATIERGYSFEVRMRKIRALYDDLLGLREAGAPTRGDAAIMTGPTCETIEVRTHDRGGLAENLSRWEAFVARRGTLPLSYHPAWLAIIDRGLRQTPYCLEAVDEAGATRGLLPLAYLNTLLFGRFLIGVPYLNYGGPMADDDAIARLLIDRAVELADHLDVRYLELRAERAVEHPALTQRPGSKVHMRLPLPESCDVLWKAIHSKVRNQVRKGQKSGLEVAWGGEELLDDFYAVFSENMRDLGTPVFGRELFRATVRQFPDRSEFCVVRAGGRAAAAALLLHGWGITEVPSASSLRRHNKYNANMLMYWELLSRAVGRGQATFDFGRSSPDSNTYQFKKQWGAVQAPAEWQYYVRAGSVTDMRPDNPRYRRMIRIWQRLPVGLTRLIGPPIVRGIP